MMTSLFAKFFSYAKNILTTAENLKEMFVKCIIATNLIRLLSMSIFAISRHFSSCQKMVVQMGQGSFTKIYFDNCKEKCVICVIEITSARLLF